MFVVVQGRINSPPLISKDTLLKLGMLHFREDGSFAEVNEMRIREGKSEIKTIKEEAFGNPRLKKITTNR